jgi:AAA+ ATPase superfamily predicted ATPase
VETGEGAPDEGSPRFASPLYFILAAARAHEALAVPAPCVSVLADRDDWLRRDYEKVFAWHVESSARVKELEGELARRRGWRWWLKLPLIRLGLLK